jgi:hypothetical protein
MAETKERYITVGFIGEADIDTHARPEETLENLYNISEQCGYLTSKGIWTQFFKQIIISTPEGEFFIDYDPDYETPPGDNNLKEPRFKFKGVFIKKRIQ